MQIKFIVTAAAVVFAAFLIAPAAFASERQYVGSSGVNRLGGVGLFVRHQDCGDAFKGAVMCTSQMIVENGPSKSAPDPSVNGEWVNPVYVPNGTAPTLLDFSEVQEVAHGVSLNCLGWIGSTDVIHGLVIRDDAVAGVIFDFVDCDSNIATACCK